VRPSRPGMSGPGTERLQANRARRFSSRCGYARSILVIRNLVSGCRWPVLRR